MDSMHVALKVSDKAFEQIIKDGTDVEYGADHSEELFSAKWKMLSLN